MSEKKIDLIAQLLAKAESTTPEEAQALTEHAERLMVKYAIDQAVIDARRAKEGTAREQIVTRIISFQGMYRDDLMLMGTQVVWALGSMRPLQSKSSMGDAPTTRLHIVGFESDVEQAVVLINSLHVQALIAVKDWWYSVRYGEYAYQSQAVKVRARHTFVVAFGQGAAARIEANRAKAVQEAGSGTELVLRDRKSLVDEYVDGMDLRKGRGGGRRLDSRAFQAGHEKGMTANTGERSMTQGRGLPAGAGR